MIYFCPQARPNHVITLRVGEKNYQVTAQSSKVILPVTTINSALAADSRGSTVLKQAIRVPGKNITLHTAKENHNFYCWKCTEWPRLLQATPTETNEARRGTEVTN